VSRLLREAEQRAVDLIRSHRSELEQLVDLLLEQETVDGSAVYRIVGRPTPEHKPEEMAIAPHAAATTAHGARPSRASEPPPSHQ
jgi:cell division protease FtsH